MDRGKKVAQELGSNKKVTYEKRKKVLEKQASDLSKLCGAKIGMILFGPAEGDEAVVPTIWPPENREEFENLVSSYKKRDHRQIDYDLSDYFEERVKKAQEELEKTHIKNIKAKYPGLSDSDTTEAYDILTNDELKCSIRLLQAKLEEVNSKINLMNQNKPMDAQSVQENRNICQQQFLMPTYDPQIIEATGSFNMNIDGASSSNINFIPNAEDACAYIPDSQGLGFGVSRH